MWRAEKGVEVTGHLRRVGAPAERTEEETVEGEERKETLWRTHLWSLLLPAHASIVGLSCWGVLRGEVQRTMKP